MRSPTSFIVLAALAAMAGGIERPASAQADAPWKVEGKLVGKTKDGKEKKSEDVSGIACLSGGLPRKCLVIDDEVQFAQVVIVRDGSLVAGDTITLVDPIRGKWSLDGEGVAFSAGVPPSPDYFYVIGSHGHPRDRKKELDAVKDADEIKARFDASSLLIRLTIDPDSISSKGKLTAAPHGMAAVDLRPLIFSEPKLAPLRPFVGKRLEEENRGLTIEGIAAVQGRLYVGLRAPTLDGDRAAVISFDRDAPFDGTATNMQLSLLPLGPKRGVRDLAAHGTGILILAGPAYEPNTAPAAGKSGEYSIFSWDRDSTLILLKDLPQYSEDGSALKPEAILPLRTNNDGTLDVLLLFDGATEGGPRLVRIGN
jgi:hypothetical protein